MQTPGSDMSLPSGNGNPAATSADENMNDASVPEGTHGSSSGTRSTATALSEKELVDRLAFMESRVKLLENLFNPESAIADNKSVADSDNESDDEGSDLGFVIDNYKGYFSNIIWYMSMARAEYEDEMKKRRSDKKAKKTAKNKMVAGDSVKLVSLEEASTAAYLADEPSRISWLGWRDFLAPKGRFEESPNVPIYAVIGEPDPKVILNLGWIPMDLQTPISKPIGDRPSERDPDNKGALELRSLPERLKIHSNPLLLILTWIFEGRAVWETAHDGSVVFLRPFREFLYYETQLREFLKNLENFCKSLPESPEPVEDCNGDKSGIETNAETNVRQKGAEKTRKEASGSSVDKKSVEDIPNPMTALLHLRCLMSFIDEDIKPKYDYLEGKDYRRILFNDLWSLFKPGTIVVDQEERQGYRVIRVESPRHKVEEPYKRFQKQDSSDYGREDEEPDLPMRIHCAYIDFNGEKFGPVSERFAISPYGEAKEIKTLPIYPLRFARDADIREKLIKRGKKLLDVSDFKAMYYIGPTLDTREEIDGQVVVDFNEALASYDRQDWKPSVENLRTSPERIVGSQKCEAPCCLNQAILDDSYVESKLTEDFVRTLVPEGFRSGSLLFSPRTAKDMQSDSENAPTEDELVIMTYRVFGFILRSRKWAKLDLTHLHYDNKDMREFTLDAFQQLALPDGHRDMVKGLVSQHFRDRQSSSSRNEQVDVIKGKGKGLIILLHGAPGVGKTTTAEGIAEVFHKPLFHITCGDLGSNANQVDSQLEENFALASRWGCILLLDEADVFLSSRERNSFERNGLVAVFLRVMEYYTGILFLTTNRIGDFDEAFQSRIHMSLFYPELDEEKTKRVFSLNLSLTEQRLARQGRKLIYDASSVEKFAVDHYRQHEAQRWNGRQIRNLCQTALALAEYDAHEQTEKDEKDQDTSTQLTTKRETTVQLQLKYFVIVQKSYIEFGEYMGATRGTAGEQRAIDQGWRARQGTAHETTPSLFTKSKDSAKNSPRPGQTSPSKATPQDDGFQPLSNQNYGQMNPSAQYGQPNMGYGNPQHLQQHPMSPQNQQMLYSQSQMNQGFFPMQPGQQVPQMGFQQPVQNHGMQMQYTPTGQFPGQQVQGQGFQGQMMQNPQQQYNQQPMQNNMQGNMPGNTVGGADNSGQPIQPNQPSGPIGGMGP